MSLIDSMQQGLRQLSCGGFHFRRSLRCGQTTALYKFLSDSHITVASIMEDESVLLIRGIQNPAPCLRTFESLYTFVLNINVRLFQRRPGSCEAVTDTTGCHNVRAGRAYRTPYELWQMSMGHWWNDNLSWKLKFEAINLPPIPHVFTPDPSWTALELYLGIRDEKPSEHKP
jgi:hypothetical protein